MGEEPNKPSYTPTEVGVIGTAPVSGQVAVFDGTTGKIKSTGFTIASSVPSGAKFTDTTYSAATSTALGLVKVGYTESGKNYPVELDADDKMFVNVPWTDTNTTYSQATSSTLGLIKIGYTESGKNYPVELNTSGQAFVNVPWTDTTYSVFTPAEFDSDGTTGLVPAPLQGEQNKYLRANGTWETPDYAAFQGATTTNAGKKGLVPAPSAGQSTRYLSSSGQWSVPAGTTYDKATADTLGLVRIGYTESGQNYPIELDPYGKMYVNVPWEDTTYRAGRALVLEGNAFSVANSGVSSGTYGNTSSVTVEIGESFNVPAFTVDQYGRLTQAMVRPVTVTAPTMVGATSSSAGTGGLVPRPPAGDSYRYLSANGAFQTIPEVNSVRAGLAPKGSGDGRTFLNGSGNYITPPVADISYSGALPKLSGNSNTFLNGNGEWDIPPAFKGYTTGAVGQAGYVPAPMSANKYLKSDGTWADAVYGIKGNAETTYRVGQVNLTAANIGALSLSSGGTVSGLTTFESRVTITQAGFLTYDDGFY